MESMTDQLSRLLVLQIVGNTTVADGNVKSAIVRHGLIDQSKRLVSFGKVGADADLTVFDPERIIDTATFEEDLSFSIGIEHVFVLGTAVVKNGATVPDTYPGQPILGRFAAGS